MTMQIRWRKNPKTEEGWFKRIAISMLVALGGFVIATPLSFLLFLNHLQQASPNDTQNVLGAITSSVVVGLVFAGFCFFATMMILFLLSFRTQPEKSKA